MLVLPVLIGSPIGIIHLHLIFLAHQSWNGNLWKRMREKSRTFLHSGIHHQPRVQFIQVCSELFMLCHTYIYVVLYFAKKKYFILPLVISNFKKSPTVPPRWALTHTYVLTTMSAWRSFSHLSVCTALEHRAFDLWHMS